MANGWTPERRARQSKLIKQWKPWNRSTGPQTNEGKTRSSHNAYKGGVRALFKETRGLLNQQEQALKNL